MDKDFLYLALFLGSIVICFTINRIYKFLCKRNELEKKKIEFLTPPEITKEENTSEVKKMYVHAGAADKMYKCEANIIVRKKTIYATTIKTARQISTEILSYEIEQFYFSNGGHISFSPDNCFLELDKPVQLLGSDGKTYTITLTNEMVEDSVAEKNDVRMFKNKIKSQLERLTSATLKDFPQYATIIAEYNDVIERKLFRQIPDQKRRIEIQMLWTHYNKKLTEIEQRYKIYKYQLDVLKSAFPEIEHFDWSDNKNYFPHNETIHPENILTFIERHYEELSTNIEKNKNLKSENKIAIKQLEKTQEKIKVYDKKIDIYKKELKKLEKESKIDLSFYATLIADYDKMTCDKIKRSLKQKSRPAVKAAEQVKKVSKQLHKIEKEHKLLSYQMELYEKLFPWITEYKEVTFEDIKAVVKEGNPTAGTEQEYLREYLSEKEYNKLSTAEKYQLALDRYKKRKKTSWQIGIAYERYIGYLYESQGYKVEYFGAKKGLEDLGRDLIAKKGTEILIIQCKYWNTHKTIHEKHIFQLYGTMFAYSIKHEGKNIPTGRKIKGLFITSTKLSDMAKEYANRLNIEYQENVNFEKDYPCVKCNIGKDGKIYHLPFDQQYDNVLIDYTQGECYTNTVAEAEALGFRRAFKWTGNT